MAVADDAMVPDGIVAPELFWRAATIRDDLPSTVRVKPAADPAQRLA